MSTVDFLLSRIASLIDCLRLYDTLGDADDISWRFDKYLKIYCKRFNFCHFIRNQQYTVQRKLEQCISKFWNMFYHIIMEMIANEFKCRQISFRNEKNIEIERFDEWVSEWMNEWIIEWINEWVNEWESEWIREWMRDRTNIQQNILPYPYKQTHARSGVLKEFWVGVRPCMHMYKNDCAHETIAGTRVSPSLNDVR